MQQELLKKIETVLIEWDRKQSIPSGVHSLLIRCLDELPKQAAKADAWDHIYSMLEHSVRIGDELPNGTAESSKSEIVDASLEVWREQQKRIRVLEAAVKELQFSDLGCCRGCDREDLDGCKPDCKYTKLLKGE